MATCVTCGNELHPERAEKYNYCTDRKCQERNAKGLTILALAVNKAADQYQVLDEPTKERVASGRYVEEMATGTQRDRRRTSPEQRGRGRHQNARRPVRGAPSGRRAATSKAAGRPWTESQQDLAVIYNSRGTRPDEIARKLNLSTSTVIEMLLAAKAGAAVGAGGATGSTRPAPPRWRSNLRPPPKPTSTCTPRCSPPASTSCWRCDPGPRGGLILLPLLNHEGRPLPRKHA
jgi:hypothetical protein